MHNVLKVKNKLKDLSLHEEHQLGPLPFEFRQYSQFSGIKYIDLYCSISYGDNCIKVDSSYGRVRNIFTYSSDDESETVVLFERFTQHSDFFTDPLKSSDLGILKVSTLCGNIESVLVSEIVCKFVMIR